MAHLFNTNPLVLLLGFRLICLLLLLLSYACYHCLFYSIHSIYYCYTFALFVIVSNTRIHAYNVACNMGQPTSQAKSSQAAKAGIVQKIVVVVVVAWHETQSE